MKKIKLTIQRLTGEVCSHPRSILENNNGDQNMTTSYPAHSNLPPNCSVSRPEYAFAIHFSIFKPKILEIPESEIRQYPLDYLPQ